jgi:Cof subfamily protein (haloacid dehalogenase superfamily)
MKYKLIAMDMDGTLLNSKKEVSERTREVLGKAAALGVKLVVCTGRIFTSALVYADIIGSSAPVVASNGAYIREKDRNEIIYEKNLDPDKALKIAGMAERYGFYPHIFTADTIYTKKIIHFSENYNRWNQTSPEEYKSKINVVDDFEAAIGECRDRLLKVAVMTDDIENLQRLRREITESVEISIMSSYYNSFEAMEAGVSKGSAVKYLADYFGFSTEEVICIGDNENDLSMIEYAGLGVAMGNSEENLKEIADYITETNDNDGVAAVIEKFILNS